MSERHLPIQIRGYRPMDKEPQSPKDRRLPGWVLVFDTETSIDHAQRLHFGGFILASVRYNDDGTIRVRPCIEGLFADDDLPIFNPEGYAALVKYMTDNYGNCPRLADIWPWGAPSDDDMAHGEIDIFDSVGPDLRTMSRSLFVQYYIKENGHTSDLSPDREYEPCMITGFNLPFDISRLADGVGEARGGWDIGAVSLNFDYAFMPNVVLKRMGAKGVEIHSKRNGTERNKSKDAAPNATWLDLSNLVFALTSRNHSLRSAGEAFGCRYLKTDAPDGHGSITPEYVEYLRNDVRATLDLWRAAMERFLKHPLNLAPDRAYSAASIAKQYFRDMGIMGPVSRQDWITAATAVQYGYRSEAPFMRKSALRKAKVGYRNSGQERIDPKLLARAMGSFFGGRSECRIRHEMLPVVLLDFKSMYPTIVSLLGIWDLFISDNISLAETDTAVVQELLNNLTIADLFKPALWPQLAGFADIMPDGTDYLPVRSGYGKNGSPGIGVNYPVTDQPVPYTLLDIAASKIATGHAPRIIKAWKLTGSDNWQTGLKPINFNGDPDLRMDPRTDNLATKVIELRQIAQNQHESNRPVDSDTVKPVDTDVPCRHHPEPCPACRRIIEMDILIDMSNQIGRLVDPPDRDRYFDEIKRFHANDSVADIGIWSEDTSKCRCDGCVNEYGLKIFANAGFYGVFAEMNTPRKPKDSPTKDTVYGIGGQSWDNVRNPEEPGEFCFPPFASLITAGARLMLAMLEASVKDAGGTHVFCDTDSLCIVANSDGKLSGKIPALTYDQVEDIRQRFNTLNPYNREVIPDLLKWEHPKRRDREIKCVAISAKRYCLFYLDQNGNPQIEQMASPDGNAVEVADDAELSIEKRSEHGLGLYMNPLGTTCRCEHGHAEHGRNDMGYTPCLVCSCSNYKRYDWMGAVWRYIIDRYTLGNAVAEPTWFNWPATMRVSITSWDTLHAFDRFNQGKSYAEGIKPWNFAVSYSLSPVSRMLNPNMRLVAPFYTDLSLWQSVPVYDMHSSDEVAVRITTSPSDWTDGPLFGDATDNDVIQVQTYRDIVRAYVKHPEAKYDGADGKECSGNTTGQLHSTTVIASSYEHIGKSSHQRLTADATLAKGRTYYRRYDSDSESRILDTVRLIVNDRFTSASKLLAELQERNSRTSLSTLERFRKGGTVPLSVPTEILTEIAREIASEHLAAIGIPTPNRFCNDELFSRWRIGREHGLL